MVTASSTITVLEGSAGIRPCSLPQAAVIFRLGQRVKRGSESVQGRQQVCLRCDWDPSPVATPQTQGRGAPAGAPQYRADSSGILVALFARPA